MSTVGKARQHLLKINYPQSHNKKKICTINFFSSTMDSNKLVGSKDINLFLNLLKDWLACFVENRFDRLGDPPILGIYF